MEQEQAQVQEQTPAVGAGSQRGWRWFASSRYPSLNITLTPAEDKTATSKAVRGRYLILKRGPKPDVFQGDGENGTNNISGTDKNDSRFWGIEKVFEPGPEPEDGYTDDGKDVPRSERFTAAQKKQARKDMDVLRDSIYYRKTEQNNEVDRLMELKELDWDPTFMSGTIKVVTPAKQSFGKEQAKQALEAPPETRIEPAKVRVPSLGKKKAVTA